MASSEFAEAIRVFILEKKSDQDRESAFYREVLTGIRPDRLVSTSHDDAQAEAERLRAYVVALDQEHGQRSKLRGFAQRLSRVVSGLVQFTGACDVLVQAGPAAAQLVYGGTRLLLQLAVKVTECYENIVAILEDINDYVDCFAVFAAAHQGSRLVRKHLVASYKAIIDFWLQASQLLSKPSIRTLFSRTRTQLSRQWTKYRDVLQDGDRQVRKASQTAQLARQVQNDAEASQEADRKAMRQVIEWIKGKESDDALDFRSKCRKTAGKRHSNSCQWFTQHPTFESWLAATRGWPLWLHAFPGTGKSVLAAHVAQQLEEQTWRTHVDQQWKVAYYAFSFDDASRKMTLTALRSIAIQILTTFSTVPESVDQLHHEDTSKGWQHLTELDTAVDVVNALIKRVPRMHIVIDGLDECGDRVDLLKILPGLLKQPPLGVVKWFLTSRGERDFTDFIRTNDLCAISAPPENFKHDVHDYMTEGLRKYAGLCCDDEIDMWVTRSEGNFLWAYHLLRSLQTDSHLTCQADVIRALRTFPADLRGYYERSIRLLVSNRSNEQQRLARRTFMLVAGAVQPLRLSEISHALACTEAHGFRKDEIPKPGSIETLCSGLVTFEREANTKRDDPILTFSHKSVRDFFVDDTLKATASGAVASFFTTVQDACCELGLACLRYLSCASYGKPYDVIRFLESDEHAFLQHSSAFWHLYLSQTEPSPSTRASVLRFLQSPCFWSCIAAQTYTVPHLFARYHETRSGRYRPQTYGRARPNNERELYYGSPLPLWLDEPGHGAEDLVQRLHTFIVQWHPILSSHPAAFQQAVMHNEWEACVPERDGFLSDRASASSVGEVPGPVPGKVSVACLSFDIELDCVLYQVIEYDDGTGVRHVKKFSQSVPCDMVKPVGTLLSSQDISSVQQGNIVIFKDCFTHDSSWRVHCDSLAVEKSSSSSHKLTELLYPQATDGGWTVHETPCTIQGQGICYCGPNAFYCVSDKRPIRSHGPSNRSGTNSGSGSDQSSPSSDSDDSAIELDHDLGHSLNRCIILVSPTAPPKWSFWQSERRHEFMQPACSPQGAIAVWSPRTYEANFMRVASGQVMSAVLPEPSSAEFGKQTAVFKSFHFSRSEDVIYYLVYTVDAAGFDVLHQRLSISSLSLSWSSNGNPQLDRISSQRAIDTASIGHLQSPYILTAWTSDFVYVAMPPLTCDPKLVRLRLSSILQDGSEPEFETPVEPIYFPSNTPQRHPKLYATTTAEGREKIVLTLDSFGEVEQPAVVMMWTFHLDSDWRAWNKDTDTESEEYKRKDDVYQRLRGSFVAANQKFYVPIRSGLDWRKKAFLSCA
ncbi:hypothetical protein M409DRAFT_48687 [Zasmidium cellare ATCC 36951]|uniref:Uncharacterized protein n=1 Tax=Zasmidium cellare ATCC 36951 TaxID=1080233 RepID=A0A6A6D3X7_ZASCE|nr:uncharacterized protein M409DRAFT_48687 [Zasmidium cellare ATCC 36951]KAF2173755.1 hypothetical protein M409DRAFT_48687 [Zasmidium cellare ATCC 36951]